MIQWLGRVSGCAKPTAPRAQKGDHPRNLGRQWSMAVDRGSSRTAELAAVTNLYSARPNDLCTPPRRIPKRPEFPPRRNISQRPNCIGQPVHMSGASLLPTRCCRVSTRPVGTRIRDHGSVGITYQSIRLRHCGLRIKDSGHWAWPRSRPQEDSRGHMPIPLHQIPEIW